MVNDTSIREDETDTAAPWDTVSFPPPSRPTVTDANGQPRELTDYEFRRWEESKEDTEMRREAAAAQAGTSTIDRLMGARPRAVKPLDDDTIYQFALSGSIHEDRVLSLTTGEHDDVTPHLSDATNFLRSMRETLIKIDTAYKDSMLDKSLNADRRSLNLEKETSTAFVKAYARRGTALEALAAKIAYTEGLLDKPLETQAASQRSTELRGVLRELKSGERNELIRAAINAEKPSRQQLEILQAVLGANHITVGITEVEQALHVRTYNGRTQPQLLRRLELQKKCFAMIESLEVKTIQSQYEGAMRSKFSRASAISGLSSKAAASLAAINS